METNFYYELLGYTASVLIAISLMMSAVVKLRIINLFGSSAFAVYGLLIGSLPVSLMNGAISLINIYHLVGIARSKEYFELLRVPPESPYLHHFLKFYEKQIRRFQPAFDFRAKPDWMPVFVLRNAVPAGLILGTRSADHRFRVELDFAIPKYRDFKIARYLFQTKRAFFLNQEIEIIESPRGNDVHDAYLERIGFQQDPSRPDWYVLEVNDNNPKDEDVK